MNSVIVRRYLYSILGNYITVKVFYPRNKCEIFYGKIIKIYRSIFIIKLSNNQLKCFNINDIITKTIRIYL